MPRGLFNWTAEDVVRFLREKKFSHHHSKGSHFFYVGTSGGKLRIVCVPFHGTHAIKPRTLKGIIEQSGISKDQWLA
jgi:predicted RNA binding protein YcfA (HicA-like mRNA interferase family)